MKLVLLATALVLLFLGVAVEGQIAHDCSASGRGLVAACNSKTPFCRVLQTPTTSSCALNTCSQQSQLWCHSSALTPFCRINSLGSCVDGAAATPFPQSVQSGSVAFGKGLYGATLAYDFVSGVQRPKGTCGVDWFCHGNSTCNAASTGCVCSSPCWTGPLCNLAVVRTPIPVAPGGVVYDWYDTIDRNVNVNRELNTTYAYDPVLVKGYYTIAYLSRTVRYFGGPFGFSLNGRSAIQVASPIPAPPRLPSVCYVDMPTPLACTHCTNGTSCVRQTPGRTFGALGVTVPASDVCCPRGFAGDDCTTPVGCSLSGCDNGGTCVRSDRNGTALRPQDSFCEGCPKGVALANGTIVHGWHGQWCHETNNDGRGPKRYATAEGIFRRLLQAANQISGVVTAGIPSQRACDCGSIWSTSQHTRSALTGEYLLLTGNHPRNDLTGSLLSRVGYALGNTVHPPLVARPMGGDPGPEARYLCAQDAYCSGFLLVPVNNTAIFFTTTNNGASTMASLLPSGVTFTVHRIDRTTRRRGCASATLDPLYYFANQRASIDRNVTVGSFVGNIEITDDPTLRAIVHWRLFGHLEGVRPSSGCDATVIINQYVGYCNATLPVEPFLYSQPDISLTCAPINKTFADRYEPFGIPLFPTQTGVVAPGDVPTCECRSPFTASNTNNTDCASALLCGRDRGSGRVNASWLALSEQISLAVPESCVCDYPFVTDPSTCKGRVCDWCTNTLCEHGTSNPNNRGCDCPTIYTGDRCEILLCNTTNTFRYDRLRYNATLRTEELWCECKPEFYGDFCDNRCVHGFYSNALGRCVCNARSGHFGEFCEKPLCASDNVVGIHGVMEYDPRFFLDKTVSDVDAGFCRCFPPFEGANCQFDSCGINRAAVKVSAGRPDRIGSGPLQCTCNFPFASSNSSKLDCKSDVCGPFGTPDRNMTADTIPRLRCTCDTSFTSVGIYTDESCTAENCRPCALGECSLDRSFGPHQVSIRSQTNQTLLAQRGPEPCCLCNAKAANSTTFNETCTSFCVNENACRYVEGRSGFTFDKVRNGYTCGCQYNFASSRNNTNACDICAPNYSSTNTSVFPATCDNYTRPDDPVFPEVIVTQPTLIDEEEETIVGGLSDPAFYALISAAGVLFLTGLSALVGGSGAAVTATTYTQAVSVPLVSQKGVSSRMRVQPSPSVGRRLLSLVVILSIATSVVGQVNDDDLWSASITSPTSTPAVFATPQFKYAPVTIYIPPEWRAFSSDGTRSDAIWMSDVTDCHPVAAGLANLQGARTTGFFSGSYADTSLIITGEEKRCGLPPTSAQTAIVGTRAGIRVNQVTFSYWRPQASDQSSPVYGYSLNLCDRPTDCNGGQCVMYAARFLAKEMNWGLQSRPIASYLSDTQNQFVRGCKCPPRTRGLRCELSCPSATSREICSGRGTCGSGQVTTTMFESHPFPPRDMIWQEWLRTCACVGGCTCDDGYTGSRCERAAQTNKLGTSPSLNFTKCCPSGSTDCDVLTSRRLTRTDLVTVGSDPSCTLTRPGACPLFINYNFFTSHQSRPRVCGEDTQSNDGRGNGVCALNFRNDNKADCWCNTPPPSQGYPSTLRRGWFGANCQKRTCTERTNMPFPRAATSANLDGVPEVRLATASSPCSGNQMPRSNTETREDFCDDLVKWTGEFPNRVYVPDSINTEGRCVECANGYGGYRGINPKSFVNTVYAPFLTGLCGEQTWHSNGGGVCGGYGTATYASTGVRIRDNGGVVRTLPVVQSCDCPPPLIRYPSGICQRTCVPAGAEGMFKVNETDGTLISIGSRTIDNACNSNGLCYPITTGTNAIDGFNSACVCAAGFNGPSCNVDDLRFFDQGFPVRGVSPSPAVTTIGGTTFCGSGGNGEAEPIVLPGPKLDERPQFDYFLRRIVPMQGAELASNTGYSASQCRCKPGAPAGWNTAENDKKVCARTCAALVGSNGRVCSGNGQCISDPFGQSMDKGCRCNLGWGGDDCSQPILRDGVGAVCGGNGVAVYNDTHRLQQRCQCFGGGEFVVEAPSQICARVCPLGRDPSTGVLQACTNPLYGLCVVNATTGNDRYCKCNSGYQGSANCDSTGTPSAKGLISNALYSCTYRGDEDPVSGVCRCRSGYVGSTCEVDTSALPCGDGQSFQDNNAIGYTIVNPTQVTVNTTTVLSKAGQFDPARYLLANLTIAELGLDAWMSYRTDGFFRKVKLWLTNGYSGILNVTTVPASPPALLTLL